MYDLYDMDQDKEMTCIPENKFEKLKGEGPLLKEDIESREKKMMKKYAYDISKKYRDEYDTF